MSAAPIAPDEPYVPETGCEADDREILRQTRGSASAPLRGRAGGVQEQSGGSLLSPPSGALLEKLDELEARVASGEGVAHEEVQRLRQLAALRLLRSRRPSAVAAAIRLLEASCAKRNGHDQDLVGQLVRRSGFK